jgi:hypothetical protein
MGGSSGSGVKTVNASDYIKAPTYAGPDWSAWGSLFGGTQSMQNQLMKETADAVPTVQKADISGLQGMARDEAAINAGASQNLEKQFNPGAAQLRSELPKALASDLSGMPSQDLSNWWTKMGLADTVATGTNTGSGFGRSALVDSTRQNYMQERQRAEQGASSYLNANQAPTAGLDPGTLASLKLSTDATNAQNLDAYKAANLQAGSADVQGMNSEIQSLLGATTQQQQFNAQQYQAYQQAMLQSATNNASMQNQMSAGSSAGSGAMISAGVESAGAIAAASLIAL